MPINSYRHKRFAKDPALTAQEVIDEVILMSLEKTGDCHEGVYLINRVGGLIWALLDGERRVHEISAIVANEFEVGTDQAESDLIVFLQQLEQIGAVWAV
jgi:hypothetical protein